MKKSPGRPSLTLQITAADFSVLIAIREVTRKFGDTIDEMFPTDFIGEALLQIEHILHALSGLERNWQDWVLGKFKTDLKRDGFWESLGLEEFIPWSADKFYDRLSYAGTSRPVDKNETPKT